MKELLNVGALNCAVVMATSDRRWPSINALASEIGISPGQLSSARTGRFGLSVERRDLVASTLDLDPSWLVLPALARSGDVETRRVVAEVRRFRETFDQWQTDMVAALSERNK